MSDVVPFPDPEDRRRKLAAEVDEIQRRQAVAEIDEMCGTLHRMSSQLFDFQMPPASQDDAGVLVARGKVLAAAHMLGMVFGTLADAGASLSNEEYAKSCLAQLQQPAAAVAP